MTQDNDNLDEEDIDRLTNGTLIDGDIPNEYPDDIHTDSESELCVFNRTVTIKKPEHRDTAFTIHPETVPYRGTPMIDFFYGRPAIYLYTPLEEEVQYIFALPTKNDPFLRPLQFPKK